MMSRQLTSLLYLVLRWIKCRLFDTPEYLLERRQGRT